MARSSRERFFDRERPAAVLKHAILNQYVVPFTSMTGSRSTERRVVYVDGYAGRGRSQSGADGSPALIVKAAHTVSGYRTLECHFVEKDRENHDALRALLESEATGLTWETYHGAVEEHLDRLLAAAEGVPLFMFLDPFGFGVSFDDVVNKIYARPRHQYAAATEVLLNFSANAVRRTAGVLDSEKDNPAAPAQIAALTRMCGGDWWQEIWRTKVDNEDFVNRVADRYMREVAAAASCYGITIDVRNRKDLSIAYHLVFLTRRREGMYKFSEALSLAQERWRRAVFDETWDFDEAGVDPDVVFATEEEVLADGWKARLYNNVRGLLREHAQFTIGDRFFDVYNGVLGEARGIHLREVLAQLHDEDATSSNKSGDLISKVVVRA